MASSSLLVTDGVLVAGAKNFIAAAAGAGPGQLYLFCQLRAGPGQLYLFCQLNRFMRASGFTLITSTILLIKGEGGNAMSMF